jgi:membrane protein DedA with SNARE-associated domain
MPALIAHYGVLIVVLVIFAGEIGLPTLVPGEIAILIAGVQVVHSVPMLIGTWVLFGVVDILACSSIHLASRTCGNRLLVRLLRYLQPKKQRHEEIIEGWRRRLGGHDPLVVFITRLIPMFRLYASVTTGLIRIRFRDFVCGAVPASLLWAAIPLSLGYALRAKAGALEGQFPLMIHIVIAITPTVLVGSMVMAWVRSADSRPAALRRLRFALGLAAVGGALTRLILVAVHADALFNYRSIVPIAQAVSIWITILSLVALALLWMAAHDLRVICSHGQWVPGVPQRVRSIGALSALAWVSLMLMFGALNTVTAVPPATVLGALHTVATLQAAAIFG